MARVRRFIDVLNWDSLIAPGVVACKDGMLLAGWRLGGLDTESMEEDAHASWLAHLSFALSGLGDEHTIWVVFRRSPWIAQEIAPGNAHGPAQGPAQGTAQGIAQGKSDSIIEETGKVACDLLAYDAQQLLSQPGITWQNDLLLYLGWRSGAPLHASMGSPDGINEIIAAFEEECSNLETRIGDRFGLERIDGPSYGMSGSTPGSTSGGPSGSTSGTTTNNSAANNSANHTCELITHLAALLGQQRKPLHLRDDMLPMGLDVMIGPDVIQPVLEGPVRIDDRPMAVLGLEGLRETYHLAALEHLQNLNMAYSWVTRFESFSPATARKEVLWKQKMWRQAGADIKTNISGEGNGDTGSKRFENRMAQDTENTFERIARGDEGHGRFVSVFLVHGEDGQSHSDLGPSIRALREEVQFAQAELREERTNAIPALLSALPGHGSVNPRAVMVRAQVMADLMPVRGIWHGNPQCPSPQLPAGTPALMQALTDTGEHFHFNLHHHEVGHTLIFGPTGAGKSVLLGQITAAWLRYPDAQVIYFDRQRSIAHATAALGGVFLEPGLPSDERASNERACDNKTSGERTSGGKPSDKPQGIDQTLEGSAHKVATGIAPLAHIHQLGPAWALDWLCELIRLATNEKPSAEQVAELREATTSLMQIPDPSLIKVREFVQNTGLRMALDGWLEGPHAGAFDHDDTDIDDGLDSAELTVFETHKLFEAREAVTILSLDYIFAQSARRFDGRPTLIILDEAWSFFEHEIFQDRIRSWLKEGRKSNVAVVMATQSVSDAARSGFTSELLESCPTRLFLPNAEATTSVSAPQYEALGLQNAQIRLIARAQPKRDIYLVTPAGKRVISLPLGPGGLSIVGHTSTRDSARALSMMRAGGNFWTDLWPQLTNTEGLNPGTGAVNPGSPRPGVTVPGVTVPGVSDPGAIDPGPTNPRPPNMEPQDVEPHSLEPQHMESEHTEPEHREPERAEHQHSEPESMEEQQDGGKTQAVHSMGF